MKHPVLLHKESYVMHLLVKHFRERCEHKGRGMAISTIRSNGYYIIGVTRLVASLIFRCVTCRRLHHKPKIQKMANLPKARTEPSLPFTNIALDCFGPYTVTERREEMRSRCMVF